jgi:hypothetical protein
MKEGQEILSSNTVESSFAQKGSPTNSAIKQVPRETTIENGTVLAID